MALRRANIRRWWTHSIGGDNSNRSSSPSRSNIPTIADALLKGATTAPFLFAMAAHPAQ